MKGFQIQVIKSAIIFPYNPANAVPGEASANPLDVRFKLTTRCPGGMDTDKDGSILIVIPPEGFNFPSVCRKFDPDPQDPALQAMGYRGIPGASECNPDGFLNPEIRMVYYR